MSVHLLLRRVLGRRRLSMILNVFTRNQPSKGGDNISKITDKKLEIIELQQRVIILQLEKLLTMIPSEFVTVLTRIDTFSNNVASVLLAIAARLDALVAAGGMTAVEEEAVKVQLAADADKLEAAAVALNALASDPNNPTPVPAPEPTPVPVPETPPSEGTPVL